MKIYATIEFNNDQGRTNREFKATKAGIKAYWAFINYLHRNRIPYVEVYRSN